MVKRQYALAVEMAVKNTGAGRGTIAVYAKKTTRTVTKVPPNGAMNVAT